MLALLSCLEWCVPQLLVPGEPWTAVADWTDRYKGRKRSDWGWDQTMVWCWVKWEEGVWGPFLNTQELQQGEILYEHTRGQLWNKRARGNNRGQKRLISFSTRGAKYEMSLPHPLRYDSTIWYSYGSTINTACTLQTIKVSLLPLKWTLGHPRHV